MVKKYKLPFLKIVEGFVKSAFAADSTGAAFAEAFDCGAFVLHAGKLRACHRQHSYSCDRYRKSLEVRYRCPAVVRSVSSYQGLEIEIDYYI